MVLSFRPPSNWGAENDWSNTAAPASNWNHLSSNPLAAGGSLWAGQQQGMGFYAPRNSQNRGSYDPTYGAYSIYDPYSGFTSAMIDADIQKWLQAEFPELFQFESGQVNSGGSWSAGNVSRNPNFGQFARDPKVFDEIEAAAAKYGVPANVVKVVLAREGSGDWSGANTGQVYLPERGHYIVGYSGITQPAAAAWGYDWNQLVGNRALQIDAVANGLSRLWREYGSQYGWEGVFSVYYSGQPDQSYTPPDSWQYGSTASYVADLMSWLNQENQWTQANGGSIGEVGSGGGGLSSPNDPAWQGVNRWDSYIASASSKYGVPANFIKAIIRLESNGDPNAGSPVGATGLMQVMPGMHGASRQQLLDPAFNVDKGTSILRANYDRYGTWELAAKAYLAGDPYSGAVDAYGTGVNAYWNTVQGYWNALDAGVSSSFGGGQGPVTNVSAIWGNQDFPISQEHGPTEFSMSPDGRKYYEYSVDLLGTWGHPGIDVSMPRGTAIYSPVGGEVIVVGSGYYTDNQGGAGELRIKLDNGHEIIFGHMAGIYVQPGQRVNPGQLIGASGTENGDHLHLEYRVPDASRNGGWAAVDPRQALQGVFTGQFSSPTATPGINRPMTYDEIILAAAQGKPVDYGMPLGAGSSWNHWMRQAMSGQIPNRRNEAPANMNPNTVASYGSRNNPYAAMMRARTPQTTRPT